MNMLKVILLSVVSILLSMNMFSNEMKDNQVEFREKWVSDTLGIKKSRMLLLDDLNIDSLILGKGKNIVFNWFGSPEICCEDSLIFMWYIDQYKIVDLSGFKYFQPCSIQNKFAGTRLCIQFNSNNIVERTVFLNY